MLLVVVGTIEFIGYVAASACCSMIQPEHSQMCTLKVGHRS
jgi:hypothetical protein